MIDIGEPFIGIVQVIAYVPTAVEPSGSEASTAP